MNKTQSLALPEYAFKHRRATVEAAVHTKRVLVLEDEFLVAETLREDLESLGVSVIGPTANCSAALELL